VLSALAEEPTRWQHGYDLVRRLGVKTGSLYPILIRLRERGLLESSWEAEPVPGRPPRHLYRLTAHGLAAAAEMAPDAPPALGRQRRSAPPARRALGGAS
jgi:DNA-binding PadR family transcriptional regulator